MNILSERFEMTEVRPVVTETCAVMAGAHVRSAPDGHRALQTVSACIFNPDITAGLHAVGLYFTRTFINFRDRPTIQKNQPEAFLYGLAHNAFCIKKGDPSHPMGGADLLAVLSEHVPHATAIRKPNAIERKWAFENGTGIRPTEVFVYPLCKVPFGNKLDGIALDIFNSVFTPKALGYPEDSLVPQAMKSTFESMAGRLYRHKGPLLPHHHLIDTSPANRL